MTKKSKEKVVACLDIQLTIITLSVSQEINGTTLITLTRLTTALCLFCNALGPSPR